MTEIWTRAKETLRACTSPVIFDCWIDPLAFVSRHDDTVVLGATDPRTLEYVLEHHGDRIRSALSVAAGCSTKLELTLCDRPAASALDDALSGAHHWNEAGPAGLPLFDRGVATPRAAAAAEDDSHLSPQLTFDRLVKGSANDLAVGAARAVAESRIAIFNPLYIQGSVGNGKTHLLHAIGNLVRQRQPGLRVRYVPTEVFIDDVIAAMHAKRGDARAVVRERYRAVDVLLIDDVQFLQGKERTQEEFFNAFNALHQLGRRIVLTADRPPAALKDVQERLRSRFIWGLIAEIAPPDEEMRLEIVQRKAAEFGLALSADVAVLVAERVRSSVRELEGVLHRLRAFHSIGGRRVDRDLARMVLGPVGASGGFADLDAILRATARHYGVRIPDLKGNDRKRQATRARMVATYLVRKHLSLSYPELGRALGGRDHSTAHHACQRVGEWIAKDSKIADDISAIEAALAPTG